MHGISIKDLEGQPRFPEIAGELLEFLAGAELVIHNAEFDVGFLEHELRLMGHDKPTITAHASVLDTLGLAREMHPGQRNNLDALCKRYEVDASNRDLHGALIDADLLARVYLAMTGGQAALSLDVAEAAIEAAAVATTVTARPEGLKLFVSEPTDDERAAHEALLDVLEQGGACIWRTDAR